MTEPEIIVMPEHGAALQRAGREDAGRDPDGVEACAECENLRRQRDALAKRLTEEIERNEKLYGDRQADRAALGIRNESMHGANEQLLRDRQRLQNEVTHLTVKLARAQDAQEKPLLETARIFETAQGELRALLVEEQVARADWAKRAIAAEGEIERLKSELRERDAGDELHRIAAEGSRRGWVELRDYSARLHRAAKRYSDNASQAGPAWEIPGIMELAEALDAAPASVREAAERDA